VKVAYIIWANSSTVYTKGALEKFIAPFKDTVITFYTFDFQLDMYKSLVARGELKCLYITHEDRSEEVFNG